MTFPGHTSTGSLQAEGQMNGNEYASRDDRFFGGDRSELQKIKGKETLQRLKRRNELRRRLAKFVGVLLFVGVLAAFACLCIFKLFVIETVKVNGSDRYTGEQLLSALDVNVGDSLFGVGSKQAATLPSKLSYIRSAKVSRELPHTLVVTLVEDEPLYYVSLYGEYFILSDTLRVLDRVFDESVPSERGLVRLELPGVNYAVAGGVLEFEDKEDYTWVIAYLDAMRTSKVDGRVTAFDLRDKFDLSLICDSIYLVEFGDGIDLATKLSTLAQILEQDAIADKGSMRIDITDPTVASALVITGDVAFEN